MLQDLDYFQCFAVLLQEQFPILFLEIMIEYVLYMAHLPRNLFAPHLIYGTLLKFSYSTKTNCEFSYLTKNNFEFNYLTKTNFEFNYLTKR